MTETEIPLYLNWSFWAVVVAVIAVILSQIPPIKELIKKVTLDLEKNFPFSSFSSNIAVDVLSLKYK